MRLKFVNDFNHLGVYYHYYTLSDVSYSSPILNQFVKLPQ